VSYSPLPGIPPDLDLARFFDQDSKAGKMRKACYDLLLRHYRRDELPTNGRFVFYELEQEGALPKHDDSINPKTGERRVRKPSQDMADALMDLRKAGLIPWDWLTDETRDVSVWRYAGTAADYLRDSVDMVRLDLWDGEQPPLIISESRAVKGALEELAAQYLVPITATGGQCGGFTVTDIVPLLHDHRHVLYIGDYEQRGPADQIEGNTRRYIEQHAERFFDDRSWRKIALTDEQVNEDTETGERLRRLAIEKLDRRYKPARPYQAIECEALGQGAIVSLVRVNLDEELRWRGLEPLEAVQVREVAERQEMARRLAGMARRR
jgi:hypothetical protein